MHAFVATSLVKFTTQTGSHFPLWIMPYLQIEDNIVIRQPVIILRVLRERRGEERGRERERERERERAVSSIKYKHVVNIIIDV